MVIKRNNGKAPARKRQPVAASSSSKSKRSPVISSSVSGNSESAAAQLDGVVDRTENATAESEAGDRVLAKTDADSGVSGTVIQPSELENVSKDAFENTKDDRPNDADCGKVNYFAEPDGQLNLLEIDTNELPEPIAYSDGKTLENTPKSISQFKVGDRIVCIEQGKDFNKHGSILQFTKSGSIFYEIDNSKISRICSVEQVNSILIKEELEICNQQSDNGNGSICAQELAQDSPTQELNCGDDRPTFLSNGTNIASQSSDEDSPTVNDLAISKPSILGEVNLETETSTSSQLHHPVNHSATTENGLEQTTIETVSPTCSEELENSNQTSQLLKTSPVSLPALIPPVTNPEPISDLSSTPYPRSGSMQNGSVLPAPTLAAPGVESESLLLRSPGALSSTGETRPPGKNKLETQLNQLELIQDGEVAAPEFLEAGYNLPVGWTNPQENRTALGLAQVQAQQSSIVPSSESQAEMETTAIEEQPWAMPLTGELQQLDSSESNISLTLPPNIGSLGKAELVSLAQEQHQIISLIDRKQFELAVEKIHRVRITGEYLIEFKKRCQYGEFLETLQSHGIGSRTAQEYMMIAKNWETIEAKARAVALLPENNRPTLGIKWALEAIRENKKQLKQEAPPKDPDGWRTPNTNDQPVVSLVRKALGGDIWLDPCSDSSSSILAAVRYHKNDDGLAQHNTWSKTVFINPPFSDPLPWVERCCFEFARGNVSTAIMLLKADVISNVGTGELINKYASAICHWRGRINFLNDEGNPVKGSDFDCALIYFGARLDLFRQNFGGRGTIATIENHYSSVNKKFLLKSEIPEFGSTQAEQKQLAAAVGLGNGRSILPDMRDADRERNERYDPHTVVDVLSVPTMPPTVPAPISENIAQPIGEPETFDETPLAVRQFETAKQNCLNDYITAISSNLSDFSDEQIAFLAKIINEESAKRIGF